MPRTQRIRAPEPVLQFTQISEEQWKFLRFRSYCESDAHAARQASVSTRTVEGWKKRSDTFRAMLSLATTQPRLFASGELLWRQPVQEEGRRRHEPLDGLARLGALYGRQEPNTAFERSVRASELAAQPKVQPAPVVDLTVPEQYQRVDAAPREMIASERALAEALGVDHAVVLGYWNGTPSIDWRPRHEAAVDIVAQFTPGFRIERWYPDAVLITSAGLIAVTDGSLSNVARCPVKRKRRCPYVGTHARVGGSCSLWDFALRTWLDQEPPDAIARAPICDRDFSISRLLAYVATATMRAHGHNGGWYAGFPVVALQGIAEHAYWKPRIARWNKLILDPWHHLRAIEQDIITNAIVDFRVAKELANQSSWTEHRR